jgi:hypothetical protein
MSTWLTGRLDNSNVGKGIFALDVMSINLPSRTTTRRSCTCVDTVAKLSRSRTVMMRSCGEQADTRENQGQTALKQSWEREKDLEIG